MASSAQATRAPLVGNPGPLRRFLALLVACLIPGWGTLPAPAQTPEISLSGPSPTLVVQTAWAGQQPDPVTDGPTTLTYTTGSSGTFRIVASLDAPLPAGVSLEVRVGTGAYHLLGTSPVVVLAGLPANTAASVPVTYRLSATVLAGVVSLGTCQVTFFLEGEP